MLRLSSNLNLPVEFSGRRTAVFGISGSGKSNTANVIVEQLIEAGEQVVFIDPKGEGWGLLSLANGKPSKLPLVIFGEPNGHIEALNESHGPRLADFVVETGRSVVLSLLGFESDQSERRFVAAFLRQLYRRKSQQPKPTRTLVVLDEAHLFVPELVRGDGAELAGAVQRIVRQGRSFGIGTLLVDQRPQDVSKRVITQCDTLVCHQLTHKTDRDALSDWVKGYDTAGQSKEFLESLASLQPGEAWVWSPGWLRLFQRAKIHRRKTFDSGAAPDGSAASRAVSRAEIDLDELRGQLSEIVEKAKAEDPKELRKRIAELERQIKENEHVIPTQPQVKLVDCPVALGIDIIRLESALSEIDVCRHHFETILAEAKLIREGALKQLPAIAARSATTKVVPSITKTSLRTSPANHGDASLSLGERKILTAVAQYPDGASPETIAVLTGYKKTSRGEYLRQLRSKGVVEGDAIIAATSAGIAALGDSFAPLPTGRDLQQYWLGRLAGGEKTLFAAILERHPQSITGDELQQLTGYKKTSTGEFLRLLKARRIVVEAGRGAVKASENLF